MAFRKIKPVVIKRHAHVGEKVERVHDAHASHCPVARSLDGAIAITTAVEHVD